MNRISLNLRSLSFLKILFLSILIIVTGCKKEDEVQQSSKPDFQPQFTVNSLSSLTPNLTSNIQQNAPSQASSQINLKLMQIDSYVMAASTWLNILQYMPGVQEENGNRSRTSSPAPPTWTWVFGPYTITYTYNQTSSQYVYSYTIDYNGCLYYSISGWEYTNGSAGHYDYYIDPNCIMSGSLSPYLQTLDWQHSSGVYDLQFSYDLMGMVDPIHFDEHINTIDGSGYFYWYSNPNGVAITCPPPPVYPAQTHSPLLSLEYECHWTNNGANGSFIDYTGSTTQYFSWP